MYSVQLKITIKNNLNVYRTIRQNQLTCTPDKHTGSPREEILVCWRKEV